MTEQLKLAYLAGIIDGEGCFSVIFHRKTSRHMTVMGVMNTSTVLMDWLQQNFGGSVYHRTSPSDKSHWKERYEWRLYTFAVDELLPKLLPLLVIKRRQAELILDLRTSLREKKNRSQGLPAETLAYRERIRTEIRAINDRRISY